MNQTDVEYSIRQMSATIATNTADDYGILDEACNAEFPKLYTDTITAPWMVEVGLLEEWPYGPTYRCCKCDADIVIAIPPEYPEEACTLCQGKVITEFIFGVGEVTTIEPCKQHTNTPCSRVEVTTPVTTPATTCTITEVINIESCKQHTNALCSSAHDLKLSIILGILFLGIVSEF